MKKNRINVKLLSTSKLEEMLPRATGSEKVKILNELTKRNK